MDIWMELYTGGRQRGFVFVKMDVEVDLYNIDN
jgi:hypothetical protein